MKTKILFILFLIKNKVFFTYLKSLSNLHTTIFNIWNAYTAEYWIKTAKFDYYNGHRFKPLVAEWRWCLIKNNIKL
mgnify:CR=1 FL=1